MSRLSLFGIALALNGCTLIKNTEVPMGTYVAKSDRAFVVSVGGQAVVRLQHTIRNHSRSCRSLRRSAVVEFKHVGGERYRFTRARCKGGAITWRSGRYLPSGQYRVEVTYKNRRNFTKKPLVFADYKNPEFASDSNHTPEGALKWESKPLKRTLNAQAGNKTDWVEMKGEGVTSLVFVPQEGAKLSAALYQVAGKKKRRLRRLYPRKSVSVRLDPGTFVKVTSGRYEPERSYSLLRSKGAARRTVELDVIDLYPVTDQESVVLLETTGEVKEDQAVQVFGRRGSRREFLGVCRMEAVEGEQSPCLLPSNPQRRFETYEAQAVLEG